MGARITSILCLVFLPVGSLAATFEGCYILHLESWQPPAKENGTYFLIPERIRLTHDLSSPGEFAVRAFPGDSSLNLQEATWHISNSRVQMTLSANGLSGVAFDLREDTLGLIGIARTFWDFPATEQHSAATARRTNCPRIGHDV